MPYFTPAFPPWDMKLLSAGSIGPNGPMALDRQRRCSPVTGLPDGGDESQGGIPVEEVEALSLFVPLRNWSAAIQ